MSDMYRLEEHLELEKPLQQQLEEGTEEWENEVPPLSKRRLVGFTFLVSGGFALAGVILLLMGSWVTSIAGALILLLAVVGIVDALRPGGGRIARALIDSEFRSWPFGSSWKEYQSPSSKRFPPRD